MRLSLTVQRHTYYALLGWNAQAWDSGCTANLTIWEGAAIGAHRLASSTVKVA
jgi:hypothetical protein